MRRVMQSTMPALALVLAVSPVYGAIKNIVPLKDVLVSEDYIFSAKVERVDPEKPSVIFSVAETFKGKPKFQRLAVNLTGDAEAKREQQTPKLLKRLAPEMTVIMFAHRQGKNYLAFVYSNGTWFQMLGQGDSDESLRWSFNHLEPYFRRTFRGSTEELKQVVIDGLSGKREPPKPDEKAPPGIGPEVETKDRPRGPSRQPPLAVIPTFVVIGPLAILATLFPTVFGGLAMLMRRWMVSLSLTCLISTVYFVVLLLYARLQGTWIGNTGFMWGAFAGLSAAAALWAAHRYRRAVRQQESDAWLPGKWDRIVLAGLSMAGVVIVAVGVYLGRSMLRSPWLDVLATFTPVWVTTLALAYYSPRRQDLPATSLEVVFLWSIAIACGLVAGIEFGRSERRVRQVLSNSDQPIPRLNDSPAWMFQPGGSGMILSSPRVDGGRVFVGALVGAGFRQHGRVYAIDAESGKEIWRFDDNEGMRGNFSSPFVAAGKVYIGEGFHEDRDCRVFCLKADTGEKVWEFPTTSHTESSPIVVDGRVYIGAGDDGLYCLDAENGKPIWHVENLHVDAEPTFHDGMLYVGSGVGDIYKTTVLLCLNASDGKEVWRIPLEYPTFAAVVVSGRHAFVGMGNGNYSMSAADPRGALLCVDARSGKRIWQFDGIDSVLSKPAVDDANVWLTSRDGFTYCLRRSDGRVRWKYQHRSPVVASPVLVADGDKKVVRTLYVAASDGVVACLDADRGTPFWSLDLAAEAKQPEALVDGTPAVQIRMVDGIERRVLYIGFAAGKDPMQLATMLQRLCRIEDEVK